MELTVLRSQRFCFLRLLPVAVLALLSLAPQPVAAQTRVTPQTSVATLAPTGTACTASPQLFPVPDFGQTEHTAIIAFTVVAPEVSVSFVANGPGVTQFTISDTLVGLPGPNNDGIINASGYYPQLFVSVTCSPMTGRFSLFYAGTSATPFVVAGQTLSGQTDKIFYVTQPAGTSINPANGITPPYGTSGGNVVFDYTGAGPAASAVFVRCFNSSGITIFTYGLAVTSGLVQTFPIPALPCAAIELGYTAGGASASTFNADYSFAPPGYPSAATTAAWHNANITSATTTSVKGTGGILKKVIVNTSAAGTVKLYDIGAAGCAGAPASGLFATITLLAASQPVPLRYDAIMYNGICVVTSGTPDITVTYQ